MALRKFIVACNSDTSLLGPVTAGLTAAATVLTFGSIERPVGSMLVGFASGWVFPVTLPALVMYHLWQENKGRVLAKHYHKRKRELWVDDFLVDLDD